MKRKLISFIIPAYNEEDCVDKLYTALDKLFAQLADKYDCEAIIVENGSTDHTYEKLLAIHKRDPRFKIIKLARNFQSDGGMTAGLKYAKGDAAVFMSADLEDPPELVLEFVKKWEEGYQNIYGIVGKRPASWLRRFNSKMFYWLINKLTGGMVPKNASDYRLMDKLLYSTLNSMNERNRMLRGMVAWAGFKSAGVKYDRGQRAGGESKARTLHVLALAVKGILSLSYVPLRMITGIGFFLSIVAFLALILLTFKFIFFGVPFPGFGSIVCLLLLLFGFLFITLGIMSEYLGMIFTEVKARPSFIVEQEIGLNNPPSP